MNTKLIVVFGILFISWLVSELIVHRRYIEAIDRELARRKENQE